jgi:hypothetical protein
MQIELGLGNKIVTDIYDDTNGEWAGIAISNHPANVGEVVDTGANTVAELNPILTIVTGNPLSLDVIISACKRAKKKLLKSKGVKT